MVSGGASQSKATLQQGLPLRAKRGAAGQFWTFTMSNSKASTFAETMRFDAETRMHVTFTRTASGAALASEASGQRGQLYDARAASPPIADSLMRARPNADDARGV